MARPTVDKNQKRYYAYREYIVMNGTEINLFVGLTNSVSRGHHNGYSRYHFNIPCWKTLMDNLCEELGYDNLNALAKVYPIQRTYDKYRTNYWEARAKFAELNNDLQPLVCYNFVECIQPSIEDLDKYIGELVVPKVSSTDAINTNSLLLITQTKGN